MFMVSVCDICVLIHTSPKYSLGLLEFFAKSNDREPNYPISWKASEPRTGNTVSVSAQKLPALP
jgi:hypothetical protein